MLSQMQRGFTFIELMLVAFIISAIVTFAVPAYENYLYRGQVAEAWLVSHPMKQACLDYYAYRGEFPADQAALGFTFSEPVGQYLAAVSIQAGTIHFTFGNNSADVLQGKQLSLVPTVLNQQPLLVTWDCHSEDIPATLVPSGCHSN